MPEMPEVETIARDLRSSQIVGHKITRVEIYWPGCIAGMDAATFCHHLEGKQIHAIGRRGKYLLLQLAQGDWITIHFRMSGHFFIESADVKHVKHEHLRLYFSSGAVLCYHDTRKFGRFSYLTSLQPLENRLGPEALDIEMQQFAYKLKSSKRLKPLLLDQTVIAGLGNIYVDESLWIAKLHPETPAYQLCALQAKELLAAIKEALLQGIERGGTTLGTSLGNYVRMHRIIGENQKGLNVFKKSGAPCLRCRTPIIKYILAGRGTHICPHCQQQFK